jgi:hypothetical protein
MVVPQPYGSVIEQHFKFPFSFLSSIFFPEEKKKNRSHQQSLCLHNTPYIRDMPHANMPKFHYPVTAAKPVTRYTTDPMKESMRFVGLHTSTEHTCHVTRETQFCTVTPSICVPSMDLASCHSSGAENLDVAHRFLEYFCTAANSTKLC